MKLILIFLAIVAALSLVMLLRNALVYRFQIKALEITSHKAKTAIAEGKEWEHFYYKLREFGTYYGMLFDLTRWTFDKFYPGI